MFLRAIEALLVHPDLSDPAAGLAGLQQIGVVEVYVCRRVANGKMMNVTRAVPRSISR
jgi:hypothetical protein